MSDGAEDVSAECDCRTQRGDGDAGQAGHHPEESDRQRQDNCPHALYGGVHEGPRGRRVRVAHAWQGRTGGAEQEEDGEPFEDKMVRLTTELAGLFAESNALQEEINKFKEGQRVQVVEGKFKGVEGVVTRFHGQQRVGIVIDGLLTAVTAYIPRAFLK